MRSELTKKQIAELAKIDKMLARIDKKLMADLIKLKQLKQERKGLEATLRNLKRAAKQSENA